VVRSPVAGLALLTAAVLARTAFGSFHSDDYLLFQDHFITSPFGFGGIWHLYTTRPLTWLSFWLNWQISGDHPLSWHLINLTIHIACVLLLHSVLRRVMPAPAALAAAAIFALHPLQVETVAWIFARSTLLCALFCLLTLRAWLDERWWLATGMFALALLAKEECVFFPFFLALLKPQARKPLLTMIALSGAAGARALFATHAIASAGAGFNAAISPGAYLLAQGAMIWRYARLLVVPIGLNFDPDLHPSAAAGAVGWVALAVLVALCVKYRQAWLLGALVILLASSSIFPADDLAADRRVYLPLIALAPALAMLPVPRPVWGGAIVIFAGLTFARTAVWQSERSLWKDAVAKSPQKVRPRIQLARALPASEGLAQLDAVAVSHPNNAALAAEKGRLHLQTNRPDLAIADFGQAAAADPANPVLWNNLGGAFALMGQEVAAKRAFQRALAADPCFADARRNLGLEMCR
jgi:hypothetical protein